MAQTIKAGDVNITRLSISSKVGGVDVDLKGQCTEINLYEDITRPFIYAEFKIMDAVGLLDKLLPIIGQEIIHVTFETPGLKTSRDLALHTFSLVDVVRGDQSKYATYVIRACSPTMITNSATYISKAYKATIATIVDDVVKRYAQYQRPVWIEQTKGSQNILIPKLHPYQAVDFLRKRASSMKNNSSAFVFFENQNGLYFITLEELILNNQIGNRRFQYFETAESHLSPDYRSILEYHCETRYDLLNSIVKGGFASSAFVFDFITKARRPLEKYSTSENFTGLGGLPTNTGEVNKAIQEAQRTDLPKHFVSHDSAKPETFIAETQLLRDLYLGNFGLTTTILVHGDSSIKAGEKVNVTTPLPHENIVVRPDMVSGDYLVTAVRHIIEMTERPRHTCSLALMRDSYAKV